MSLLLRLHHVDDAHPPVAAVVCAVIGIVVLFYGGWLGGHIVFTHGVSVEPHADIAAERQTAPDAAPSTQGEPTI